MMPQYHLPSRPPLNQKIPDGWNEKEPGYWLGYVSNLALVGIRLGMGDLAGRAVIDIDAQKVAYLTPEDWAEIQAVAAGLVDALPDEI